MNTLWKGFSAVLLVLLLVVLGGGAWLYTLYNDVLGQKDELVAENGRLIDLAEEMQVSDDVANGWVDFEAGLFYSAEDSESCVSVPLVDGDEPDPDALEVYESIREELFGEDLALLDEITDQLVAENDFLGIRTLCNYRGDWMVLGRDIRFNRSDYSVWSFDNSASVESATDLPALTFHSNVQPRFFEASEDFYMSYGMNVQEDNAGVIVTSLFDTEQSETKWSTVEVCHKGTAFEGCLGL